MTHTTRPASLTSEPPSLTFVTEPSRPITTRSDSSLQLLVIVEVLSPSTQRYDREEKAAHYRRISSLAGYVLISQEEQRLEVFSRNRDGSWTLREACSGAVDLPTIGCRLSVEDVYRNPLGG